MERWSGVGEPDDPLRADDALVGTEHEDVLLDSGGPEERDPDSGYTDSADVDVDADVVEVATSVGPMDDRPTTEIPAVVGPAPAPRGRLAGVAPWLVFAAVAVVVIAATSTWAAWLQGPTANRQSATPMLQPLPTATVAAPASPEAAPPPPSAEPEPAPEPEAKKEPAPRPTQRPRATRAPAPPPPAAAVNAPATPSGKAQPPGRDAEADGPASTADQQAAASNAEESDKGSEKDSPAESDEEGADSESDDGD